MGEYEPRDSRNVTQSRDRAPGEPPRTGPREAETREGETRQPQQGRTELDQDERGEEIEQTVAAEQQQQQAEQREEAMERDADELDSAEPGRFDRND